MTLHLCARHKGLDDVAVQLSSSVLRYWLYVSSEQSAFDHGMESDEFMLSIRIFQRPEGSQSGVGTNGLFAWLTTGRTLQ